MNKNNQLIAEFGDAYDKIVMEMYTHYEEIERLRSEKKSLAKDFGLKGLSPETIKFVKDIVHKRYTDPI